MKKWQENFLFGPICSPSKSAITSIIDAEEGEYYYFVADKNGKTYFTKNYNEHQNKVKELKNQGMWYTYE